MLTLSELSERQITIEETLRNYGYVRDAEECRYAWNHAQSEGLESLLDEFEPLALFALDHPQRFVIPGREPLGMAEGRPYEGILSRGAIEGCKRSAAWRADDRARRGVD